MTDQRTEAREAFLDFIADCDLKIEYDADVNEVGRAIDCSRFSMSGNLFALETLCGELGIRRKYEESLDDAIQRYVEAPRPGNTPAIKENQ